jgi:diketogulonate reductase-like aldo/keto reductase
MAVTLASTVPLPGGVSLPVLGLGTAGASGRACVAAVTEALRLGIRLIDTASLYGNEREVGLAVRESGVPRDDVFVTTKVASKDQGVRATVDACEASLRRLGLSVVDLYLIHWPSRRRRLDAWKAMERLLGLGKVRSIGVSNYMVRHLDEIREAGGATPAVNQIELSPFLRQADVVDACVARGIAVEAYSPLTRGRRLDDPTVRRIAAACGRSPAQVLLRWSLRHGFIPIPKSERPERIRENAAVFDFDLSPDGMGALDGLDADAHFDWDPTDVP